MEFLSALSIASLDGIGSSVLHIGKILDQTRTGRLPAQSLAGAFA